MQTAIFTFVITFSSSVFFSFLCEFVSFFFFSFFQFVFTFKVLLLYSHDHYTLTYTCRNIFNTIRTSEDTSLEKYTSHFIWKGSKGLLKVLLCEWWVGDWTELQHTDPLTLYGHNSVSFLFSWSAQPGAWGHSPFGTWSSFQHLLTN